MVNVRDLRLGNLVAAGLIICEVTSIHLVPQINEAHIRVSGFVDKDPQYCFYDYQLDPIPLTPEILEACGFVQSNEFDDTFRLNELDIYYRKGYCEWVVDDRGDNEGTRPRFIKHLHQLQNLFHSLTGQELEIKLPLTTPASAL